MSNVGIYSSPILINKFIFVGSDDQTAGGGSISFRAETYDAKMKSFIESEQQVQLGDIRCEM